MTKDSELRRIDKKMAKAIDEQKVKIKELTGLKKVTDPQASESLFEQYQKIKFQIKDVKF